MKKLYENYLGEIFGLEGSSKGRKICNEIFTKYDPIMRSGQKSCKKFKSSIQERICLYEILLKCWRKMETELVSRSNECDGNNLCLRVVHTYNARLGQHISNVNERMKVLKNELRKIKK